MILQILLLHFNKIIETLRLRLLLNPKNHFSHFLAFKLIKTSTSFTDHRVAILIAILCLLAIIENWSYEASPHLALRIYIPLWLHIVLLILTLILNVFAVWLLELWICLCTVTHSLRKLCSEIWVFVIGLTRALGCHSLSLLDLLCLWAVTLVVDY